MKFPILLILVIIFASISVGTTYAVLETFDDVDVTNNLTVGNKVGIGTTNPKAVLDVEGKMRVGGGRFQVGGFDGGNNFWFKGDTPEPGSLFMKFTQNVDQSAKSVRIAPSAAEPGLTVTSAGRVGIGLTNPSEILDVVGNIRLTGNILSAGDICIGTCP